MKYDVSKESGAKLLDTNCEKHGSNTWLLSDGRIVCANDHLIFKPYPQCETCGIHYDVAKGHGDCKGADWKAFHTADYFTCDDSAEELSHECWDEPINDFIDNWYDPQPPHLTIDQILEKQGDVTVYAWKRKVLPTSFGFGESAIDSMLESFEEDYWGEEYGCPFEAGNPPWDKEVMEVVKKKLYATMQECVELAHIWQCEIVSEKVFTEEEVEAIVRENSPHWWEEKDNG